MNCSMFARKFFWDFRSGSRTNLDLIEPRGMSGPEVEECDCSGCSAMPRVRVRRRPRGETDVRTANRPALFPAWCRRRMKASTAAQPDRCHAAASPNATMNSRREGDFHVTLPWGSCLCGGERYHALIARSAVSFCRVML